MEMSFTVPTVNFLEEANHKNLFGTREILIKNSKSYLVVTTAVVVVSAVLRTARLSMDFARVQT